MAPRGVSEGVESPEQTHVKKELSVEEVLKPRRRPGHASLSSLSRLIQMAKRISPSQRIIDALSSVVAPVSIPAPATFRKQAFARRCWGSYIRRCFLPRAEKPFVSGSGFLRFLDSFSRCAINQRLFSTDASIFVSSELDQLGRPAEKVAG